MHCFITGADVQRSSHDDPHSLQAGRAVEGQFLEQKITFAISILLFPRWPLFVDC
jgi:hypothetical protein